MTTKKVIQTESKPKRIKRVFSNAGQVIHLWANQSQSYARCKNAFFNNGVVYSYGSHYELGRFVDYKGVRVALINDQGYSKTTNGHISSAYHAVKSHAVRLKYPLESGHSFEARLVEPAIQKAQIELVDDLVKHFNSISFRYSGRPDFYFWKEDDYLAEKIAEFNEACSKLKPDKYRLDVSESFKQAWNEHVMFRQERQRQLTTPEAEAKREKQRAGREAALERKAIRDVQAWRDGGNKPAILSSQRYELLRIVGDEVETSRGAKVPVSHAVRLLNLIESGRVKDGDRVGHFTFNGVEKYGTTETEYEVVRIGCHSILLSEAKSVLSNVKTLEVVK